MRDLRDLPDELLVERARTDPEGTSGREAASELLGRYRGRVYLWCRRYARNHDDALEMAQEALLAAYRGLGSFRGRSRFSSWLFAITRNRCLSALRPVKLLQDESEDLDALPDSGPGPDRTLEDREEERALLQLLGKELDPREQEALLLRCFERMPVDEITRILDIRTASGARGVLQNARRKLRAALEREREQEGTRHDR